MEVNFTLWSLRSVLALIPFDSSAKETIDLDFSDISAPHYIKDVFKVSIIYKDSLPFDACCCIYSPHKVVTIVIMLKKQYEDALANQIKDDAVIKLCCRRRELYCHETCHLIAIIRAFPSERSSMAREDFIAKIKEKFNNAVEYAEEIKSVPMVSREQAGVSPSSFDKDHFRYGDDGLNYFKLYQELMFSHDKMISAAQTLCENIKGGITFGGIAREAFVPPVFFDIFPEKLNAFLKLLAESLSRKNF
jgi:hypothetical protein